MDRCIELAQKAKQPSKPKKIVIRVTEDQQVAYQLLAEHLGLELSTLVRTYLDNLVTTWLGDGLDNIG